MFRIDQTSNRTAKLKPVRFSELGFGERTHLQEWIADEAEALGEELLVIQKEFAGFDDTMERLDLLALDKMGALVIIENKLDDSAADHGRSSISQRGHVDRALAAKARHSSAMLPRHTFP